MAYSLKRLLATLAVSAVTTTSVVNGYDGYAYDPNCCPAPCGPEGFGGDFFASIDYLYLQATEDGLPSGSIFREVSVSDDTFFHGRNIHHNGEWDSGFRLGLGYDLPCDCWDISAYWTWHRTDSSKHNRFGDDEFFDDGMGLAGFVGVSFDPRVAHNKWTLQVNLLDVELGRAFCVSQCLSLRPFIGIRAAWVDQKLHTRAASFDASDDEFDGFSATKLKSDYEGVGLRLGLDSEWDVGCGFSLYGCAAAAVVYGEYHNHANGFLFSDDSELTDASEEFFLHSKGHFDACRAITDASIGVRWKEFYSCDTVAFTLQLGWEHHYFFNQNRFDSPRLSSDGSFYNVRGSGDLCLQGFQLSARTDF